MSSGSGPLRQLWFRWKALKLPWRRQFLVGSDLAGNTFWEFRDQLNLTRYRRIVKYARDAHYSDIKISPQWHQWLRHTRSDAPSIAEQQYDISRQAAMKELAAAADERWNSLPSYLDSPNTQQPQPAIGSASNGAQAYPDPAHDTTAPEIEPTSKTSRIEKEENPWQREAKGAPSQNWQPEAWSPGAARR